MNDTQITTSTQRKSYKTAGLFAWLTIIIWRRLGDYRRCNNVPMLPQTIKKRTALISRTLPKCGIIQDKASSIYIGSSSLFLSSAYGTYLREFLHSIGILFLSNRYCSISIFRRLKFIWLYDYCPNYFYACLNNVLKHDYILALGCWLGGCCSWTIL